MQIHRNGPEYGGMVRDLISSRTSSQAAAGYFMAVDGTVYACVKYFESNLKDELNELLNQFSFNNLSKYFQSDPVWH
jgi:hypothetical protein